jgi:hypothetical protein
MVFSEERDARERTDRAEAPRDYPAPIVDLGAALLSPPPVIAVSSFRPPMLRHLAVLSLIACVEAPAAPRTDGAGAGISCKADADCPALACGPCTPGTVITKDMTRGPSCAVNPCSNAGATCNPQHVCVVSAGTKKNPSVWGDRDARTR